MGYSNIKASASGYASVESKIVVVNPFISTWRTFGSDENIVLPTYDGGTYDFTVDWGDGSSIEACTSWECDARLHSYSNAGDYVVTIAGIFNGLNMHKCGAYYAKPSSLINILNWGNVKIGNSCGYGAFQDAINFESIPASDLPDLQGVTTMSNMFYNARKFNGNITYWDVHNVTNMSNMFYNAGSFNQPLEWSVSNVTNMYGMFTSATLFNADISGWNVRNVTNMDEMFMFARAFSQDISNWNVAKVEDCDSFALGANNLADTVNRPMKNKITDITAQSGNCYLDSPSKNMFQ